LGAVKGLDENVGMFMDYLDSHGLRENTVVIYSSDQGFLLGEKGLFDKRWMYDPSMQMPLIISYPDHFMSGEQREEIAMNIDFAPTILELAGLKVPEDMQGESWLPLLTGNSRADWRSSMYYRLYVNEYNVPLQYGIRTGDYKLIHYKGAGNPLNKNRTPVDYDFWELFDLRADPHELNDLYDKPGYGELAAQLKSELDGLITYYEYDLAR
jgi:arylsulfatase A-like enzyme